MANKVSNKMRSINKTEEAEVAKTQNPFKATEWYKPKPKPTNMEDYIFSISYAMFLLTIDELADSLLSDDNRLYS